MANLEPISQKQFLVTLEGLKAYFNKITAPKWTIDEADYDDGATGQIFQHLGFIKYDKVTLSKMFNPVQDIEIQKFAQARADDRKRFTITIQPVNNDSKATAIQGAKSIVLTGCQVSGYTDPEVDRSGNSISMLTLEVIPQGVKYQ